MSFNKDAYKYITHTNKESGLQETIAIRSYCGKAVKGIATCDPRDSFVPYVGELLAALKCQLKIAKKRKKNADSRVAAAETALAAAQTKYEDAIRYQKHANKELLEAKKMLENFSNELT